MFTEIEKRTKSSFRPMKLKPWQPAEEMPSEWLRHGNTVAFRYLPDVVADFGPEKGTDLCELAGQLGDHFPYGDRVASGRVLSSKGSWLVEIEVQAMDEDGDDDEVSLLWMQVGEEGLFVIAHAGGDLSSVVGELPSMEVDSTFEDFVLGDG